MYIGLQVKYPLFLVDFNGTSLNGCPKNIQISNFMKISPVGAEMLHADGWTDMGR